MAKFKKFDKKVDIIRNTANIIRGLSMDGVQKANSGHPGLPMGMADVAATLWTHFMIHNPKNPNWFNRDRFVLSGGHGSMLLYSLLHLTGYDVSLDDLKEFRQMGSKTPGHPEYQDTPGVETTTGPLGQGFGNAVGMALAEKSLAARFNAEDKKIVNHYTYTFLGDGDLQEGVSHETASFAGHNKLHKLIAFYDDNEISIDGPTELSFSENVKKRFKAYGWKVIKVNGHKPAKIAKAIWEAQSQNEKPTLIICKTIIGFGSPNKQGTSACHGAPLGAEEVKLSKKELDLPVDKDFYVSEEVASYTMKETAKGKDREARWNKLFAEYKDEFPDLAAAFEKVMNNEISAEAVNAIPVFEEGKNMATRSASGAVLSAIAPEIEQLIGGSADLTPSNNTLPKGEESFSTKKPKGRYIRYGIREFGMGAIMNGMALHGGVLPYSGTFFVFSDYMRNSMRMAALMGLQVVYVLTHDSIGLGEDGPTHQPIEHLASLQLMPNLSVIRPAEANETAAAWEMALENKDKPTALVLTRQGLPILSAQKTENANKGAYILEEDAGFEIILMASGSEVEIALEAKKLLNEKAKKVRVVSMPSVDVFEVQNKEYKNSVMGDNSVPKVAVEAGSTGLWYKYIAGNGCVLGIDTFGASAPYKELYEKFGLTAENVASKALELL